MTRPPKVSVIIPAYNAADTIGRAIRSALDQSLQDFEIIVIDDASTDETAGVVRGIADPRIRLVSHEKNRGEYGARNSGVSTARGEYIAWLDADDEWLPGKLAEQVAFLDREKDFDAACVSYYYHRSKSRENEEEAPYEIVEPEDTSVKELLMGCDVSQGTTLLVRRAAVEEVGPFDEAFTRSGDWSWLIRFARDHRLAVIKNPLARVYRNPARPSAAVVEAHQRRLLSVHAQDLKAAGSYHRRRAVARRQLELAWYHYKEGHVIVGTSYLLRAVFTNPIQVLHDVAQRSVR